MSGKVALKFFTALWGVREGSAELRLFNKGWVHPRFYSWTEDAALILTDVIKSEDSDVFAGVLLRERAGDGSAASAEKMTSWLWADIDEKRGGSFSRILRALTHTPQMVVDSGHGWHLYWRLSRPVPVDLAQGAMNVLADRLGGDHVGDPARIMRVPGSINHKDGDEVPVRLLRYDPVFTHRFEDFDMPEAREPYTDYEGSEEWTLSSDDAPKFLVGERNSGLTRLAGAMIFKGVAPDEMLPALLAENEVRCLPPLPPREVETIVRSVTRYR